jgi:glutathione synthase/RimK-type ligase-like ATP-grasp enzyme
MTMVVCITHSNDYYTVDIVQQELEKRGVPFFRFNSDDFAVRYQIDYSLHQYCLSAGGETIRDSQISAVWYRKLWDLKVPEALDPAYQPVFTKEYQTFRQLFFNALQKVPWMNPMPADHFVNGDKLLQLREAHAAGLAVPASLFTNDPVAIRDFFKRCNNDVVVKLHNALSKSMKGDGAFFPTTRLTAGDLGQVDQLAYCPMIFQEYIPKAYELRVTYVDGECFTGKIPHTTANTPTDWRTMTSSTLQWQHYDLPLPIQQKIGVLMQRLGLIFGAIDIIRHTNGDYVFLEVNPQGEWGMLQKYLDYPIGETIAHKLITRIKNG